MWELLPPRVRLTGSPSLSDRNQRQLIQDYEQFSSGLPGHLEDRVLNSYGIDLASEYAGLRVKNPFGKASGQLSLTPHQVEQDAMSGLGFAILKTVIAQDSNGCQSMREWAIPETRMRVERIRGRLGDEGWTVSWKGRGWFDTLDAYQVLFEQALNASSASGMLVVPSAKYHLPGMEESCWKDDEYKVTTLRLLQTWEKCCSGRPMPLEKDFSPTLAGSERASQQEKIKEWLRAVPGLVLESAPGRVRVGLKIFNTLFDDDFQLQMLETVHQAANEGGRANFLVYGNRLFDPNKEFEGKRGIAYGGPDLSDRNLSVLERFLSNRADKTPTELLPISASGNVHSGRIAAEYLLRGASTFQMHTVFQLPSSAFSMKCGNKAQKALHRLLFHPQEGLIAWLLHLQNMFGWQKAINIKQSAHWCQVHWNEVARELGAVAERALSTSIIKVAHETLSTTIDGISRDNGRS
jgi:hypothetical protein